MKQVTYWEPKNIRRPRRKFSRHGELTPGFAHLLSQIYSDIHILGTGSTHIFRRLVIITLSHSNSHLISNIYYRYKFVCCRSQWPCGLRRRSTAARLLRSWVRIPPGAWMFVCCECCVLSGRGLCDELITRPEESYRMWCVVVCDLETS